MTTRRAVAIYARISQDRDGDELGVRRQVADCRREAERRGWVVAEEYVDDDVSAFSGTRRPRYQQMLTDIAEGRRDAVVTWHMDRLHRRPIELEQFLQVCDQAGVTDLVTLTGDLDLTNGDALLMARLQAAVAANASHSASRRIKRKAQEIAESGRPSMGGPRPFGFAQDKVTHLPAEAAVVRDLARRALAGETLTSMTTWLQAEGIRTVGGCDWRTQTVRQMLTNPRMWGMRTHNGQVIGPAAWEPIISAEDGERLRRLLLDPARRTNRSARRYLLTGMLTCGVCGSRLRSTPKDGVRRYGCVMGPDFHGCGRIFIYAQNLEQFITDAVLYRLDTPELARALTQAPNQDAEAQALQTAVEEDQRRLTDLAQDWADRLITRPEWLAARERIQPRLETNRRNLIQISGRAAVADYIGHGAELRQRWDSLNLPRQVAVVKAVLAGATILPAKVLGRHGLDPNRVVPDWRL